MDLPARLLFGTSVSALTFLAVGTAHADPTLPGGLTNNLAQAASCVMCHSFNNADGHEDQPLYAPYFGWAGTLMANAARDPVFWAGVAIADQDGPGQTEDCIRCHSPRAFLQGRGDATEITDLDAAAGDFEGVTCELCHRMVDEGNIGNAQYTIDDMLVGGNVPRRGPWDDYVAPNTPPHSWTADPYTGSSELCGTCHDVSTNTPRVDDDGTEIAPVFNEQRTYSEWLNSDYAIAGDDFRSCQDCHMPPVADMAACEAFINFMSHSTGGRRHDLVGANRFMVELLKQEYGSAGTDEVLDFYFDQSMDRMDELLATAATVELAGPASVSLGEGLAGLTATVTNNSGHKLPSGYSEGRVMWLEITARYGDEVVWTSGAFERGVGPADDPQLRTYQAVAEELASGETFHLLLNNHWVEDTRIPPRGLVADPQTDPVGDRYTMQGGVWPNFDVAPYDFAGNADIADATPGDGSDDQLVVTARLWYLINTPGYIQFLADANVTNDAGSDVAMLFDTAGGAPPLLLAEDELTIPIDGFGASGTSSDDGMVDSSGAGPDTGVDTGDDAPGDTGMPTTAPPDTGGESTGTGGSAANDDDSGGGCNCSTRDRSGAGWLLLLPVLGLLTRPRRGSAARPARRA